MAGGGEGVLRGGEERERGEDEGGVSSVLSGVSSLT